MSNFSDRLAHAWNVFRGRDPTVRNDWDVGPGYSSRPDKIQYRVSNERSILISAFNRMAIDVAAINIWHVTLDENGMFKELIDDDLNQRLNVEANLDQTGRQFIQEIVMDMFDEGVIALVPTDTDEEPNETGSYNIRSIRCGKIVQWHPQHVLVELYDETDGQRKMCMMHKRECAIIENPLYDTMNAPNSTLRRLSLKLNTLDAIDKQSGAGKLDLIIQLPYSLRSEGKRQQAAARKRDIENQLYNTKYGIAYIDSSEHVTQLNRSVDNNLMSQVEYLERLLFSQLGLTQAVFDGTASESEMLNYYNRTIEPILSAISLEITRKFITKNARTRGHSIFFVRNPFKLASIDKISDIADKFTRNEILSPNEIRAIVGYKPSNDPEADELRNRNLNESKNMEEPPAMDSEYNDEENFGQSAIRGNDTNSHSKGQKFAKGIGSLFRF